MTPLIGLESQQAFFLEALKMQRMPHAWLFYGPSKTGKATFAHQCARLLLQDKDHHTKNSTLESAHHFIDQGTHPDFLKIEPQDKDIILVEDVKPLRDFIQKTPERALYQVVLIDGVHLMTETAANALLKSLEEPKANVVFFLVSSSWDRTKITLRSRCIRVAFPPLSRNVFERHEKGPDAVLLYDLTQGRPGFLREADRESWIDLYEKFCISLAYDTPHSFRLAYFKIYKDLENFENILWAFWRRFLREEEAGENEQEAFQRMQAVSPAKIWNLGERLSALFRDYHHLNLDHSQVLMNTFFCISLSIKGELPHVS